MDNISSGLDTLPSRTTSSTNNNHHHHQRFATQSQYNYSGGLNSKPKNSYYLGLDNNGVSPFPSFYPSSSNSNKPQQYLIHPYTPSFSFLPKTTKNKLKSSLSEEEGGEERGDQYENDKSIMKNSLDFNDNRSDNDNSRTINEQSINEMDIVNINTTTSGSDIDSSSTTHPIETTTTTTTTTSSLPSSKYYYYQPQQKPSHILSDDGDDENDDLPISPSLSSSSFKSKKLKSNKLSQSPQQKPLFKSIIDKWSNVNKNINQLDQKETHYHHHSGNSIPLLPLPKSSSSPGKSTRAKQYEGKESFGILNFLIRILVFPLLLIASIPFIISISGFLVFLSIFSFSAISILLFLLMATPFFIIGVVGVFYLGSFLLYGSVSQIHKPLVSLFLKIYENVMTFIAWVITFIILKFKILLSNQNSGNNNPNCFKNVNTRHYHYHN